MLGTVERRVLGRDDDRHVVTVAGSRAGKSSTVLIPNLLRYPGSVTIPGFQSQLGPNCDGCAQVSDGGELGRPQTAEPRGGKPGGMDDIAAAEEYHHADIARALLAHFNRDDVGVVAEDFAAALVIMREAMFHGGDNSLTKPVWKAMEQERRQGCLF